MKDIEQLPNEYTDKVDDIQTKKSFSQQQVLENDVNTDIGISKHIDDKTSLTKNEITEASQETTSEGDIANLQEVKKEPKQEMENVQTLQPNYNLLSKSELLELAKKTLKEKKLPIPKMITRFNIWKKRIESISKSEKEASKIAYAEKLGSEIGFSYKQSQEILDFERLYVHFEKIKTAYETKVAHEQKKNSKEKEAILDTINKLIETTFDVPEIKRLQYEWKAIRNIAREEVPRHQEAFRKMIFNYKRQSKIQYDFARLEQDKNLTLKQELCTKIEALLELSDSYKAYKTFNQLFDEFKRVGPVPFRQKDAIWERLKTARNQIFKKREEDAKIYKESLKANMLLKQNICLDLEKFTSFESSNLKEWYEATSQIKNIEQEWHSIGHIPRENMAFMNKHYKSLLDKFYENRRTFFKKFDDIKKNNLDLKVKLCEKAESLIDNNDWSKTSNILIKLQKEWYAIGPVPTEEQKITKRFKKACDAFFTNKRNYIKEKSNIAKNQIKEKEGVIDNIVNIEGNVKIFKTEIESKIKTFVENSQELPQREAKELAKKFIEESGKVIDQLEITSIKKKQLRTTIYAQLYCQIESLRTILERDRYKLTKQIDQLNYEAEVLENNLSFFDQASKVKGFNSEIEKFQNKLLTIKKELEIKNNRLKIIRKYI